MNQTAPSHLRRFALGLTGILLALVPMLALVANADASSRRVAAPNPSFGLAASTIGEGSTVVVKTKLTCPFSECDYALRAVNGTATAGVDFNLGAAKTIALSKGRSKSVKLKVSTLRDGACETSEYFWIKLGGTWSGGGRAKAVNRKLKVVIKGDKSCAPATVPQTDPGSGSNGGPGPEQVPTPTPTPAPAPIPDTTDERSTQGKQTTTNAGLTIAARCTTDLTPGVTGQAGAQGDFISGCTVKLTCPAAVKVCRASAPSRIDLEFYRGESVSLNQRMRVFSAAGTEFFHRDTTCAGKDHCGANDTLMIRGGESASVECNGVRQTTQGNRARNECQLLLDQQ